MRHSLQTAALLVLTGCSANNFTTTPPLAPTLPATPNFPAFSSPYHALGDSITAGYLLPDPVTQAYPILTGQAKGFPTLNNGYSGDLACDLPGYAIFPNHEDASLASPLHYSVLIGTNDVQIYGTGAHEADFLLCHRAVLAWLAVPSDFKLRATAASVITAGPGAFVTMDNVTTWTTGAAGSSISFPVHLPAAGPAYLWYRIAFGNPGSFTYAVDRTTLGTVASGFALPQQGNHGFTSSVALLRIPSVPAGDHTLTLTQTSTAPFGMGIVAVGIVPPANQPGLSRVLAGTIPRQLAQSSGAACSVSDQPCAQYTEDILADVQIFAADGLNVQAFDTHKYTTGTHADMMDNLHPNTLGHQEIAHALTDAF